MSGITFTTRGREEGSNRVRESSANLPGRGLLSVTAWPGTRLIGLGLTHDFMMGVEKTKTHAVRKTGI